MAKSHERKAVRNLDEFLRRAKTADGVNAVEIGFFSDAKYPDGTPVTNVAAYNEFGTENKDGSERIPERPFFRQAIPKMKTPVLAVLVADVNPRTMVVDRRTAERCGGGRAGRAATADRAAERTAQCAEYDKGQG